jgi:hypothetical protein
MKDLPQLYNVIHEECQSVKIFANKNGFHHGTMMWPIIKQYRDSLKGVMEMIKIDIDDGIKNYSDIE